MDLDLNFQTLVTINTSELRELCFSNGGVLQIESPALISIDGYSSTCDAASRDVELDPMHPLVGKRVSTSEVSATGELAVIFEDGSRIDVAPDDDYEAWNYRAPGGAIFVCLPGGDMATWATPR